MALSDALNNKSVNDSYNDDHSDNSDNSDNSIDTAVDVALTDNFNNKSVNDSYNDDHTDNSINTEVDVALTDALNNKSVNDSYNDSSDNSDNSFDLDVDIEDAFNTSDTDWLDLEGLNFDVMQTIGEALNGDGNDNAFSLAQVSEMTDNDTLNGPTISSSGPWAQLGGAEGGISDGIDATAMLPTSTADASEVAASATSAATAHMEASQPEHLDGREHPVQHDEHQRRRRGRRTG